MIRDTLCIFDDKRDVTDSTTSTAAFTAAATVLCNKSYDTGAAGAPAATGPGGAIGAGKPWNGTANTLFHDIGRGRSLRLEVMVGTTLLASGGAATLEVDFISATDGALSSSKTVLLKSPAVAKAALVAGYRFPFRTLPPKIEQEFIGVQYLPVTNNIDTGVISSGIVIDVDEHAEVVGGGTP